MIRICPHHPAERVGMRSRKRKSSTASRGVLDGGTAEHFVPEAL
jgi:hypothetical protein